MTEAGYEQNEQVKRISSWAAIFFAPSFIASVYGMNFDNMPELSWSLGYPFALLLMALLSGLLYAAFKRKGGSDARAGLAARAAEAAAVHERLPADRRAAAGAGRSACP